VKDQAVVEAALFSAGGALSVDEIARLTGVPPDAAKTHLRKLAKEYEARGSAVEVAQIGTKWTMQIRTEYSDRARAFAPPEIDRDLLKTAALIAYHQPILQSDLSGMIGDRVYEHTQNLERLGLITRKPSGHSLQLTTTRYFAEAFGLKATDREGIRKLMAQKAGIVHRERPPETGVAGGTETPGTAPDVVDAPGPG